MHVNRAQRNGFTLVEVLVATSIGAFVALVAIASLRSTSQANALVQDGSDRAIELRFAARRLAMDLANIVRDTDPNCFKLEVGVEDSGFGSQSYLIFWTISHEKVRAGQPEGDVHEVGYFLTSRDGRTVLCRRQWPHPNRDVEQPGGVVTVLTDQVALMKVLCYDGQQWHEQWLDTAQELPHLIEVTLVGKTEGNGIALSESILVTVMTTSQVQAQSLAQGAAEQMQAGQAIGESTTSGQITTQSSGSQMSTGGGR